MSIHTFDLTSHTITNFIPLHLFSSWWLLLLTSKLAKPNGFGDICKKTSVCPLCSIFSKEGHVFRRIKKKPHHFYAEHPKEHVYQLGSESSSSFREDFLEEITLKMEKNVEKRLLTQTWLNRLNENLTTDRSHHVEHFYLVRNWLNPTVLETYAKNFCLTHLFYS